MDHVIPNGWEEKKLGDICEFRNGLWTGKKDPFIECNVIRNANFTKDFKLNYENVVRINVEEKQFPVRELKYGDLILEKSGGGPNQPVGRVVIFDKQEKGYSFSNFTSSIRIKNKEFLDFRFLYLYLCYCYTLGITVKMQKNSTGIRNLQLDEYKNIHIPFPNLSEQQCIVEKLDKIFAELDKEKAIAEQNLSNAKELFESYLNQIFANIDNNSYKKLSDVARIIGGGTPSKANSEFYNGDIPWATVRDMNTDILVNTEYQITNEAVLESATNIIPKNSVIIATRVGLGKVCLLNQNTAINQDLKGIIPIKQIENKFLYWWFCSVKDTIINAGIGATVKGVKLPFIQNLKIPYITISQQQQIVSKLDYLQSQTQELEKIYTQKLYLIEELKQSVLHKAFQGEL